EARKSWTGSGEAATEALWFEIRDEIGATDFFGYDTESAEGKVVAIVYNNERVESAEAGQQVGIVANQTPFYGESGGQIGDTGEIRGGEGLRFVVTDTQKKVGDLVVHWGRVEDGTVRVGNTIVLDVDHERRATIRANHSATHLLHAALRRQLGNHITQKGSLVAPDRLRFDISHPKPIAPAEIVAVENDVNAQVRRNGEVTTRLMDPEAAVAAGAMALFGEKYGDEVRVVAMGLDDDDAYSVELCGGTHVRRTGDVGLFKIVSEGALAAGVRRLEAVTGAGAEAHVAKEEAALREAAALLKAAPADVPGRIAALLEERRKLERELSDTRRALATGGGGERTAIRTVAGVNFSPRVVDGVPAKDLKGLADDLKKQVGSGVVALVSTAEGKASLVVGVTADLLDRISAVDLVRIGSSTLGGRGGGGRPDMAQAGGPDPLRAEAALQAIESAIERAFADAA
ncbi:MAG: alanine--tRNA ligase-related protein, partial [Rhodoplanes sp.]